MVGVIWPLEIGVVGGTLGAEEKDMVVVVRTS